VRRAFKELNISPPNELPKWLTLDHIREKLKRKIEQMTDENVKRRQLGLEEVVGRIGILPLEELQMIKESFKLSEKETEILAAKIHRIVVEKLHDKWKKRCKKLKEIMKKTREEEKRKTNIFPAGKNHSHKRILSTDITDYGQPRKIRIERRENTENVIEKMMLEEAEKGDKEDEKERIENNDIQRKVMANEEDRKQATTAFNGSLKTSNEDNEEQNTNKTEEKNSKQEDLEKQINPKRKRYNSPTITLT
jgi:hypothetical protein